MKRTRRNKLQKLSCLCFLCVWVINVTSNLKQVHTSLINAPSLFLSFFFFFTNTEPPPPPAILNCFFIVSPNTIVLIFFFMHFYPAFTFLSSGQHYIVVYVYALCINVLWLSPSPIIRPLPTDTCQSITFIYAFVPFFQLILFFRLHM